MTAQRRGRNGYGGRRKQQQKQVPVVPQQSTSEEDSTDSGSVTRCVCGESHNVGLMIQCDQCEVWQHCDCVGLLVADEMPDQYYCEECKPQNHAVVKLAHGRTKRSYSSIGRPNTMSPQVEKKAPKKRMTFNSREASMSLEDVLAARNALETNLPTLNESSAPSSPVKETEGEENNEENEHPTPSSQPSHQQQQKSKSMKKEKGEKEPSSPSSQQQKQQKQQNKKSSPVTATLQENDDMDVDPKEQDMDSEADTVMTNATSTSITRPAKPKRVGSGRKSTAESNDGGNGGVTNGRVTKTEKRSRGGGVRRANTTGTRRAQSTRPRSRTSTPQPSEINTGNGGCSGGGNSITGGIGHGNGNTMGGPTSREMDISTAIFEKLSPAAREASPPAKIRMPSSRMTISEMNRRAKQILEYISSIQVEMATKEHISSTAQATAGTITVDVNTTTLLKMNEQSTSPQSGSSASGSEVSNNKKKMKQPIHYQRSPKPNAITIPEKKNNDDDAPSSSLSSASTIPLDANEVQQRNAELDQEKGAAEEAIAKAKSEQSSMEIMDTLTRELIRFQRRFGATHDSGRGIRQSSRYYHRDMIHDAGSGSEGEGRVTRSREASAGSSTSNFLFEKRAAHT
ncbi:hypothetical protein BDA99DRAFT_68106 [Phascolomyces articulosus]|uniref:Zinc finger PHD-type domain-containing protein n=1 Tax=Phascolomyces articulosus TaxID=60185 RepID=A0AAD5PDU8_9FUNG|nr:hypothetical protein BDA99DRAFT_68106 [Phascolomyces articulosus]